MSARRYIKRIYRVPKDRGALEAFATILTKTLIKHGWPASWRTVAGDGFVIYEKEKEGQLPDDFLNAIAIATRILARTYSLDLTSYESWVGLNRHYIVLPSGQFREVKQ